MLLETSSGFALRNLGIQDLILGGAGDDDYRWS